VGTAFQRPLACLGAVPSRSGQGASETRAARAELLDITTIGTTNRAIVARFVISAVTVIR